MARSLALGVGIDATLGTACPRGPSDTTPKESNGGAAFNSNGASCSSHLKVQLPKRKSVRECCAHDGRKDFPAGSGAWPSFFGRVTSRGIGECQASSSISIAPFASRATPPALPLEAVSVANSVLCDIEDADHSEIEEKLLKALQERRTEDAWGLHKMMRRKGVLASQVCLSRLVAQLSHKGTPHSLSCAQKVLVDLQKMNQVDLLDQDSLGILVMASAKTGAARYACNILRVMLEMDMCPSVKVWSVVVSRLGKHPYDAPLALKLFDEICSYLQLGISSGDNSRLRHEDKTTVGVIERKTAGQLPARNDEEETGNMRFRDNFVDKNVLRRTTCGDGDAEENLVQKNSLKKSSSAGLRWVDVRIDTAAFNAVLNACATLGLVKEADDLLERMASFGVKPDRLTFNILIKLFANAQDGDQLVHILQEMNDAGVEPDLSTYNSLVSAYVNLGDINAAELLVRSMQQEPGHHQSETGGSRKRTDVNLVDIPAASAGNGKGYPVGMTKVLQGVERKTKVMQEEVAEDLEAQARHRGRSGNQQEQLQPLWVCKTKPNVRTYTTLMKGYVKAGRLKDAVQLLVAMQHHSDSASQPNEVSYTTVIGACIDMGLMDEAKSVLLEMAVQRIPANVVTYNVLLKGYCNAGQVSTAYEVIDDMRKAGLSPDSVSYNTLINGCIRRDDNVGALEVFREMRRANIGPTEISYTTLMTAFARNGQHKLVAEVFNEMRAQEWMRVDIIAWNVLIDAYCKAGQMDEAKQAFSDMKAQGFHPSVATYGSLVKGFQTVDKPGEVLVLWKEIQERTEAKKGAGVEPLEPDGGLLDYLVDTCLRAGFFQRALEVVACMEGQGILADKIKYKRMFIELYSTLYTSKHASAKRRAKSAERRSAVDAFKFWLGLPNQYYQSDWDP